MVRVSAGGIVNFILSKAFLNVLSEAKTPYGTTFGYYSMPEKGFDYYSLKVMIYMVEDYLTQVNFSSLNFL